MAEITELIEICRRERVYIQTHNFPDPDAIASAFGLQRLLIHYGISSTICCHGDPDKLNIRKMTELLGIKLYFYEEIRRDMRPEDYIVCVDSQKGGGNILDLVGNEVACIDHHPTYAPAEYLYSDIRRVGSCSTLIAEYYKKLDVLMPEDVATALLYGMKMDTDNFTRGVEELDIEMFKYLFPKFDRVKLGMLEHNTMEFRDLEAFGSAIENIHVIGKVGIAAIHFACPNALIAIVADFILSLEEVEIAIIYSYRTGEIRFSVRSENRAVHSGELIRRALNGIGNGGGHAEMAGGSIPGENLCRLADSPDSEIRSLFLHAVEEMGQAG